jgi:hypothetical protein
MEHTAEAVHPIELTVPAYTDATVLSTGSSNRADGIHNNVAAGQGNEIMLSTFPRGYTRRPSIGADDYLRAAVSCDRVSP